MTGLTTARWLLVAALLANGCHRPAPKAGTSAPEADAAPALASDCPPVEAVADDEIARQAAALVPLRPGLTLATAWHRSTEDDDVECLTQVRDVSASTLAATATCSMRTGTQGGSRRTCRADLRAAYMYYTGAGDDPDVLRGTTMFSLSQRAFRELKSTGRTRHRYVSLSGGAIVGDLDGVLERGTSGTLATIVNDRVVDLPVIRATGTLRGTAMNKRAETRVTAAVVDDERFPLVLDYALLDIGNGFSVRYNKVSFPTGGALEQHLASEQRVDVYGIYFDFNSDRIRSESDPVLHEIADALQRHPEWKLSVEGHTDAVGGAAVNMDLSARRSEAVRAVLVDRFGVAAERLTARGFGATVPHDTNDTAEGRARNRRVELVRQPS